MTIVPGVRLGPYEVTERIGGGGMGEVFRARDERIGRDVAIKVLHPSLAADSARLERFNQEARAAGSVGHPNIVTIYDIGSENGSPYIVMELLEGQTLRGKLAAPRPNLPKNLLWLAEVADAIAAAHGAGVVHRDLKPENVIVTKSGLAKVLDFGLAKLAIVNPGERTDVMMTTPGAIVGTIGYMSPEQAEGRSVDHRTDIFSLGSILYEVLTGKRAFAGRSAVDTLHKIIHEDPPLLASKTREVPAELQRIARKCLAKEPDERYQSAKELAIDLRHAVASLGRRSRRGERHAEVPAPSPERTAVAVLPFANLTGNPENAYLGDGVAEDLLTELSRIGTLKVVSRTSALRFTDRQQSIREIAEALRADVLIEGSVRRMGEHVRIAARVVNAAMDEQLWADACEGEISKLFSMQKELAQSVAAALVPNLTSAERARLGRPATTNVEAYRLYMQGRHCVSRMTEEGIRQGVEYYERAVVQDPHFAPPHAGIAFAYMLLSMGHGAGTMLPREAQKKAREAIDRALAIDPSFAQGHAIDGALRFMFDFDWAGAEKALERALALNPDNAETHGLYGLFLGSLERYDEAVAAQHQAHELDPLAPLCMSDTASALLRAGRVDEALQQAAALLRLEPAYPMGHSTMGWAYIKKGRQEEGLTALEEAVRVSPGNTLFLGQLGQAYAVAGRPEKAQAVLQRLLALGAERYVSPYHLAYVYTGLGEYDRAIDCLEGAVDERCGGVYGIRGSFLFTDLRSHPRFTALLKRMHLEPALR